MIGGVQNIGKITELRQRILFTFAMLAVYRLGVFIVTPGINAEVIKSFFEQMAGTMFGLFSMFSGGALANISDGTVLAITASAPRTLTAARRPSGSTTT